MSMKHARKSPNGVEQLFPALLFFVFLLCTIFTILIGSRVYENIRTRNDASFHTDTALAYMTNKVRQSDRAGAVSVREIDETPVLVLESEYETIIFETWIYQMDGALWELFAEKDAGLDLFAGQKIMDCGPVSFEIEVQENGDSILTILLGGFHLGHETTYDEASHETNSANIANSGHPEANEMVNSNSDKTVNSGANDISTHEARILLRSTKSKKGGAV